MSVRCYPHSGIWTHPLILLGSLYDAWTSLVKSKELFVSCEAPGKAFFRYKRVPRNFSVNQIIRVCWHWENVSKNGRHWNSHHKLIIVSKLPSRPINAKHVRIFFLIPELNTFIKTFSRFLRIKRKVGTRLIRTCRPLFIIAIRENSGSFFPSSPWKKKKITYSGRIGKPKSSSKNSKEKFSPGK